MRKTKGSKKRDKRYQRDSQTHKFKTTDNAMAKNEKDKQTTAHTINRYNEVQQQKEPAYMITHYLITLKFKVILM